MIEAGVSAFTASIPSSHEGQKSGHIRRAKIDFQRSPLPYNAEYFARTIDSHDHLNQQRQLEWIGFGNPGRGGSRAF